MENRLSGIDLSDVFDVTELSENQREYVETLLAEKLGKKTSLKINKTVIIRSKEEEKSPAGFTVDAGGCVGYFNSVNGVWAWYCPAGAYPPAN